jgi:pimeloyl-ACP methyl ester carboxylesterase
MANIILIAGTHHGGWYWDSIATDLRAMGNTVFAPTLSGLDDQNEYYGDINLDTHIQDVLNLIEENRLKNLVLVASSYGGMVITGVADRTSAAIRSLIYLDACLPLPGQSEWDLISDDLRSKFEKSISDGKNIDVPQEWLTFRPRLMPHPLATKKQPLNYSQTKFQECNKIYVHAEQGFGPGGEHFFARCYERVKAFGDWKTYSLPAGHDLATELPWEVLDIISEHSAGSI